MTQNNVVMNRLDDISDDALLKEVGHRIAHLRISAKMKQGDLAAKAGMSSFALSRLENGAGGIRLDSSLSALSCLKVLNKLSILLPEPTLTPLQVAEFEKRAKKMPKRIRTVRAMGGRTWGDENPVK
jgi:DNA-binding Xre family transcriptional regulator